MTQIKDDCGPDAKLIYAEDAQGSIGKRPAPDACVLSADFIVAMCAYGAKK